MEKLGTVPVIHDIHTVMKRLDAENIHEYVMMPVDNAIPDDNDEPKSNISDDDLKLYIVGKTGLRTSQDVASLDKKERNGILKDLCTFGASIRQIS